MSSTQRGRGGGDFELVSVTLPRYEQWQPSRRLWRDMSTAAVSCLANNSNNNLLLWEIFLHCVANDKCYTILDNNKVKLVVKVTTIKIISTI